MFSSKNRRALSRPALDAMLERLGHDQDLAGLKYQEIRAALIRYLRCGGCLTPEEHADEVINIVAERVLENKPFNSSNPNAHFFAVARNLLRDYWKKRDRQPLPLEELPPGLQPFHDPEEEQQERARRETSERQAECLDRCLRELAVEEYDLILRYYMNEKAEKTRGRREIAGETGKSINALRVKAHRIRKKLERCCDECMQLPE